MHARCKRRGSVRLEPSVQERQMFMGFQSGLTLITIARSLMLLEQIAATTDTDRDDNLKVWLYLNI